MNASLSQWLALREPIDAAARSATLTQEVADALPRDRPVRILDLGTGTGSNLRYVARHLPVDQQWLLVDKDPRVLAELPLRMSSWLQDAVVRDGLPPPRKASADRRSLGEGGQTVPFETRQLDLGARDASEIFAARDLVTASALLDLVSAPFLTWLAERCHASGALALFALTYTGRSTCEPAEPEDDRMCAWLNRHQTQSDKGFGPSAGPDAVECAARVFAAAGYRVRREPSDWHVGPDARELQQLLIQGWTEAALAMAPAESATIADWRARRFTHVAAGQSRIVVCHEDLAAFPLS